MSNQTTTPLSVGDKKTAVLERCPVCGKATKMRVWGYEVAAVCACVEEKRRQEELRRQEYERNLTICRKLPPRSGTVNGGTTITEIIADCYFTGQPDAAKQRLLAVLPMNY